MTLEQAIGILIGRYNSSVIRSRTNDDEWRLATDTVIAALRGPEPDPDTETGLVPCGCGKRAIFYGFDEERGDTKLIHRTAAGCPDCPATTDWEENQDDARRIWNKMMGYKEDA